MNWKTICEYLYKNINPETGVLHSYVNNQYHGKPFISFYVEFDMNEFTYEDPFYGEQSSTSMFKTNFELMEITKKSLISDVVEFANSSIVFEEKRKFGAYSNSLHLVPHTMNFNDVIDNELNCRIEYSITNSDSYGMMDGSFEEHINMKGFINSNLSIERLTLNSRSNDEFRKMVEQLNSDVYDINSIELFQETEYSKSYKIGYRDKLLNKTSNVPRTIKLKRDER